MDSERIAGAVADLEAYFGETILWCVCDDGTVRLQCGESATVMTGTFVNGELVVDMTWVG
jgi:hypothetical protein